MLKTIHRQEYRVLLRLIKARRRRAGLTQAECSAALGHAPSFMSDVERGARRLDVLQLRDLCRVLKTDLPAFVRGFERALPRSE
jgi:transcriptional regulator with XRE-family HTH domain